MSAAAKASDDGDDGDDGKRRMERGNGEMVQTWCRVVCEGRSYGTEKPPHTTKSSAKDSSQLTVKLLFTSMYLKPFNSRYKYQSVTIQGQSLFISNYQELDK